MRSHSPRHLKQEQNLVQAVASRRGVAVAAASAAIVPAAMTEAQAAPAAPKAAVATVKPAAAKHAINVKTTGVVVLHYGSTGNYVRVLQQRLHIYVDGHFGPRTRAAVIAFQARHGLYRDGSVGPVTWRALGGFPGGGSSTGGGTSRGGASSSAVISVAKRYIGVPYVWGGSTPRGFDCSGFVQYVFHKVGKNLPRTASAQQAIVRRVSSPSSGDLFFTGWPAHHVGFYVGNGLALDARSPGTRIQIHTLWGAHNFGRA